jgi:DNA repair exonuclease SbcCD ATPase subunit
MRLRSIKIRNLGPFGNFACNLDSYGDAKLIAVTGENGSGKSSLLEMMTGGALYRECKTRGSLASLATTRDASLEVRLDNGKPWTIRHTVDGSNGKGESIAMDGDGNPVTFTGKVREFDDWSARSMPLPELLYSSQVIAQKSRGFGDLSLWCSDSSAWNASSP